MMTKKKLILAVLTGPFSLAACTQATPRSSDYFAEHLEEARQVVAGCRDGTVRGDECANANMAVEEADAKERRSEEHTSELQSLMRISYAVFCLKKKKIQVKYQTTTPQNTNNYANN